MNEIIEKENKFEIENYNQKAKIEDMIYEIRDIQVMFDSKIFATKCHYYLYDKIITHYDISKPMSMFNNFIMGR